MLGVIELGDKISFKIDKNNVRLGIRIGIILTKAYSNWKKYNLSYINWEDKEFTDRMLDDLYEYVLNNFETAKIYPDEEEKLEIEKIIKDSFTRVPDLLKNPVKDIELII